MPLYVRKQARLSRAWGGIHRDLEREIAEEVAEELRAIVPVDLGQGRDSIRVDGKFIKSEAHLLYIDQGVAAGRVFPPPENLEGWGRRQLGVSGLGWALSLGIYRRGIRPRRFVRKAWSNVARRGRPRLESVLIRRMRRALG